MESRIKNIKSAYLVKFKGRTGNNLCEICFLLKASKSNFYRFQIVFVGFSEI